VRRLLPVVAFILSVASPALAEDPEVIVKRLRSAGAECHYILSICSDTVRAEGALARLQGGGAEGDKSRDENLAAAETRVAKQIDLLTRAAAAVRQKHTAVPECFRHCERLRETK
jgi:hypothetical protein